MPTSALKIWTNVPDGSTLELWLESADETWGGSARLLTSTPGGSQKEEMWTHAQIHPGPKRKTLRSKNGYATRVRVGCAGAEKATVRVCARIVKPGGVQYGSGYAYTISGKSPEVKRATIIAITKAAGGGS